ncbi:hypothetical protein J6590_105904, partial [Homalodisca vitripennis]
MAVNFFLKENICRFRKTLCFTLIHFKLAQRSRITYCINSPMCVFLPQTYGGSEWNMAESCKQTVTCWHRHVPAYTPYILSCKQALC